MKRVQQYLRQLLPLVVMLFTAAHCEKERADCHYRITFVNHSNKVIYVDWTREEYYDSGFPNPLNSPQFYKIDAMQTSRDALFSRDCIEYKFRGKNPTDTMLVFVIDAEVLANTPWEQVKEERLFLKEYKLGLEDLQKMDWRIVFSGAD